MTTYLLEIAGYAIVIFFIGITAQSFSRWFRGRKQLKMHYGEKKSEPQPPPKVAVGQ